MRKIVEVKSKYSDGIFHWEAKTVDAEPQDYKIMAFDQSELFSRYDDEKTIFDAFCEAVKKIEKEFYHKVTEDDRLSIGITLSGDNSLVSSIPETMLLRAVLEEEASASA